MTTVTPCTSQLLRERIAESLSRFHSRHCTLFRMRITRAVVWVALGAAWCIKLWSM